MDISTLARDDSSYVVAAPSHSGEYVAFGRTINLSKRAANQILRGLAKIDQRYSDKRDPKARVLKNTTARKNGILA